MTIYKAFETAKNGTQIPVFLSGRTMESRYNPERDAENLLSTIDLNDSFFIVPGVGSGLFIKLLSQRLPQAKIIAFEFFQEDLDFLKQSQIVQELAVNPSVIFTDSDKLEETLLNNYLPAKYGDVKIIQQKNWLNENQERLADLNQIINKTIGIISADYSVQAHFGKIWTSNILNNSLLAQRASAFSFAESKEAILKKTAVIVAAGPSLDRTIKLLSEADSPDKYFIFATDTAGQALIRQNIIPDVVVSIDGQSVSYNHFISSSSKQDKATLFAFDLSSNTSAARYIYQAGKPLSFFTSGHPLSQAVNAANGSTLPSYFSGAGTVTITAVDMAVQSGFKNILILGADFSYSKGKAYTAGTYLDTLYNKASFRLSESEGTFSRLMFRTELKDLSQDSKTTQVLEAYKLSLENYLAQKNISYKKENEIYTLKVPSLQNNSSKGIFTQAGSNFSLKAFLEKLKAASFEESEMLLLPYVAWLRNNDAYKKLPYNDLVKLALESIVSYNI